MTTTNRLLIIANTLLALILVLVIVQVATPNANAASSTIAACANKKTGVLRLAKPACTSSENKVAWGIKGPAGPKGATGTQGPAGSNGSNATVSTKTVTIRYVGNGTTFSQCGNGEMESWNFNARTFRGTWYDSPSLISSSNWISNSYCYITLKVIE
jgi:hypothetical protein